MQFVCPSCGKVSKEMILARAKSKEAVAIAIVERVAIECQLCKAICQDTIQLQLSMKDVTPEELANLQVGARNSFPLVM